MGTPPVSRVPLRSLYAGATGCASIFLIMKVVTVFDVPLGRYGKLGTTLAVLFLSGMAIGRMVSRTGLQRPWRLAATGFGAALIGIAAAVVGWTFLEDLVFSRLGPYPIYQERTLFPLDVAMLWVYGSPPLLLGIATGVIWGPTPVSTVRSSDAQP
jgi:hypothetical protein